MSVREDQSDNLCHAMFWTREARDGLTGIGARWIALQWCIQGPGSFTELPKPTVIALCRHYHIPPRTLRHHLNALRVRFGIGQGKRFAALRSAQLTTDDELKLE